MVTDQKAEIERLATFIDHVSEVQANLPLALRIEERADLRAVANILRRTVTTVNVERLRELAFAAATQYHRFAHTNPSVQGHNFTTDDQSGFATCQHPDCVLVRK